MKITIDPKDYMGGRITVMGIAAILITWFHSGVIVPRRLFAGTVQGDR